ncbi:MAG TPA: LirA/MavJ family T4SS effector [Vineibacter sp.]|nr:LirA/MavJ family T4SS effector [Vineibacter sp.]
MPKFTTPKDNSPKTFEKIIADYCPHFRDPKTRDKDPYFDDFCKIGALLQDSDVCNEHLKLLNAAMETKYDQKLQAAIQTYKSAHSNVAPTSQQYLDVRTQPRTASGYLEKMKMDNSSGTPVPVTEHFKFWSSLTAILSEKEAGWGFNKEEKDFEKSHGSGPGKIALLTGFVLPASFQQSLLRGHRHWKDPMVPGAHGEFSHRLQWFIICSEREKNFGDGHYKVILSPWHLMGATSRDKYKLDPAKTSGQDFWIWDLLCDSFYNRDDLGAGFGNTYTFRSPEYMMVTYNKKIETGQSADLLSLFIRHRLDKRTDMNLNRFDEAGAKAGKAYVSRKLQKYGIQQTDYDKFAGTDLGRVIFKQN